MNKRQYKRAVALIKKDCLLKEAYIDDKGRTCAIGCLGLAAGVSKKSLKRNGPIQWRESIMTAVRRKFGLSPDDQQQIQRLNDTHDTPRERRREIVRYLEDCVEQAG